MEICLSLEWFAIQMHGSWVLRCLVMVHYSGPDWYSRLFCLPFRCHTIDGLINDRTHIDDLITGLVRYSDPHCIYNRHLVPRRLVMQNIEMTQHFYLVG